MTDVTSSQGSVKVARRGSGIATGVSEELRDPPALLFSEVRRRGEEGLEVIRRPSISYWQDAWMRLKKNRVAVGAGVYIILLTLAAIVVPEVIPYTYDEQEIWNKHSLPTLGEEAVVVDLAHLDELTEIQYQAPSDEGSQGVGSAPGAVLVDPPSQVAKVELRRPAMSVSVAFRWSPVDGADGYRVYRSISPDTLGLPVADVPVTQLSYHDRSSLQPGETYYYFVTAFNAFGDGPASHALQVTPSLALPLDEALKINGAANIGATIRTNPHYLGTDYLGRDLLARVMIGARISLLIGFGAPLIYVFIGIVYGSLSGFFGGVVDDIMMRITDVFATVPELLVVILLQVVLGSGVSTLLIALVAVAWARSARQIRGEVLRLREMEFVQASKVLGTDFRKVVFKHLLPNVMGTVLVVLTLAVPQAIFTEAFLSFIGLGIAPPLASWGTVTKEGAKVFLTYPHELIIPSVLICATMLAFNLLGDGLRDALDPKLRGTR